MHCSKTWSLNTHPQFRVQSLQVHLPVLTLNSALTGH